MLDTLKQPKRDVVPSVFQEQYIKAFNWMLLARTVEEKLASLWRAGKIAGGGYLGKGPQAYAEALVVIFRVRFVSRTGRSRGRDGNVRRGRPREGYHAMICHLGSL